MSDIASIKFGTDGVRGVIDFDFNERVVAAVAEASLRYFSRKHDIHKVLVGYDTRRKAEHYAKIVVNICKRHDIETTLVARPTPTPVVSWYLRKYKYDLAFQITASHNPPQYCGIKVINWHGASIPDEDAEGITQILSKEHEDIEEVITTLEPSMPDVVIDPRDEYVEYVVSLLEKSGRKLRVCFDPLYGTTIGYTDKILTELGHEVKKIHYEFDPSFGGLSPNPEGENLSELRKMVTEEKFDLGIAHDGDGDRVALVLSDGSVLGGNEVLLVFTYVFASEGKIRTVARTVATTHLVDKICDSFGISLVETPVGIKYIAELLISGKADLGGEESGGVAFRWHIPEKDGILTGCMLVQLHAKQGLDNILRTIYEKYGRPVYIKRGVKVSDPKKVFSERKEKLKEALSQEGAKISEIDGLKLTYPDYTWILVRPSGTEPIIRIYCESVSPEKCEQLIEKAMTVLSS